MEHIVLKHICQRARRAEYHPLHILYYSRLLARQIPTARKIRKPSKSDLLAAVEIHLLAAIPTFDTAY
jgi:hypothetical protein